jgi:exopolyphosphatase/guanosine-5'-triphosphate,3'-diphosphate pyrophosphatase
MLDFSPAWAESHPRTLHLLREEADAWARHGSLKLVLPR